MHPHTRRLDRPTEGAELTRTTKVQPLPPSPANNYPLSRHGRGGRGEGKLPPYARAGSGFNISPSSSSCVVSTGDGADISGSEPDDAFGNAITSRMFSVPISDIISRSMPMPTPPS